MKLAMGTVDSEAIKKIGFSCAKNQNGVLRIEFADGSAVDYLDVGYSTYRKFVMSSSHGKFYNDRIRGKLKFLVRETAAEPGPSLMGRDKVLVRDLSGNPTTRPLEIAWTKCACRWLWLRLESYG